MDLLKISLQSIAQSITALSAVEAMRSTLLTSEELNEAYSASYKQNLERRINELSDLIEGSDFSSIVQELKSRGLI